MGLLQNVMVSGSSTLLVVLGYAHSKAVLLKILIVYVFCSKHSPFLSFYVQRRQFRTKADTGSKSIRLTATNAEVSSYQSL